MPPLAKMDVYPLSLEALEVLATLASASVIMFHLSHNLGGLH